MYLPHEVLAGSPPGGWGHGWDGGPGGWMALWWPLAILFWVAVIGLVVWLVLRSMGGRRGQAGGDHAATILAERYARGEISDDEYRERLAVLRAQR